MLIRDTESGDVRIDGSRIVAIGHDLPADGDEVLDAGGGALLPGLHDHHIHLRALAAARMSVDLSGTAGDDDLAGRLRGGAGEWVRATGYHESMAGRLDRWRLDGLVPDRPARVQHRTGELWVLNSAAAHLVGLPDEHDGRLWRQDEWLGDRVPTVDLDLGAVGRRAAAWGVTGFTDTTPGRSRPDAEMLASGLPQRLHLLMPLGEELPDTELVTAGPVKVMLDDTTLPTVDELAAVLADAHAAGRSVAVHCVTRVQLVVVLAAGPIAGDRIEHGAVIPPELIAEVRRLGLVVVTQPNFVVERGEQYRTDVDPDDLPSLYRCASLLAAGVPVAAGTDAPFGGADPWAAMHAAANRDLGPDERVSSRQALELFLGSPTEPGAPRRIEIGAPADLCLLHVPLAVALDDLDPANVRATFVAGHPLLT